jgi:YesN/AraC family two-component response regulator
LGISFYLLGYNSNGNLIPINETTKENLKTYLDQYRISNDREFFQMNIEDARKVIEELGKRYIKNLDS